MNWEDHQYQEHPNVLGVVQGYMKLPGAKYDHLDNRDIQGYINLARELRDTYKQEKASRQGPHAGSEAVDAVRARVQLPQPDGVEFGVGDEGGYPTRERVFFLACVAVTESRDGANFLAGIALPHRTEKGLRRHINSIINGGKVPLNK